MKQQETTLDIEQAMAQLFCLKNQLNPHFLFNSLSILSSLVRIDPVLSEKFIDRMSRTYRYILEERDQSLVPLRSELEFISSFCFLLKIRFSDKFDLRLKVQDPAIDEWHIIPLTLQPLIENAIRFNRMSVKDPLMVEISLEEDWLVVRNGLKLRVVPGGHEGTGLKNLIRRYACITERAIWAGETGDHFVVKIPLLKGPGKT